MRILILRNGRLGDMIMVLPALLELKKMYPEASLHLITSIDGLRLFKFLDFPDIELSLVRNTFPGRILDAIRVKKMIKKEKFDKIFSFQSRKRINSWLPEKAVIIQPAPELQHYALRCLHMVNETPSSNYLYDYFPFRAAELPDLLSEYSIKPDTLLIGLHPTYSGYKKSNRGNEAIHRLWSVESFSKLTLLLTEYGKKTNRDLKIIMNLLPEEYALGERIHKAAEGRFILMKPKRDFKYYLSWIKRLNILVTPNTGVMHLAAALNTPLVALFSREHPDDCGPFMSPDACRILRAEDCSESDKEGLARISEELVFQNILQLMDKVVHV